MYPTMNKTAALDRKWCIQRKLMTLRLFIILFVLVCFFIVVANCDHKAGVLPEPGLSISSGLFGKSLNIQRSLIERRVDKKPVKHDPLSLLREIYIDYNNKILTLVSLEPVGERVQKFHPNGRYGRSSVNNKDSTTHFQFGKLSANRVFGHPLNEEEEILRELVGNLLRDSSAKDQPAMKRAGPQLQIPGGISDADATSIDFQTEMSKILKCHYTGLSNLYRCDN